MVKDTQEAPAAKPARSLFTPENEAFIRKLEVNKPSGIKAVIGGVEFDVLPLCVTDGEIVLGKIDVFNALWVKVQANEVTQNDLIAAISANGVDIIKLVKDILRDAAAIDRDAVNPQFDQWAGRLPLLPTLQTLVPAIIEANGFGGLIKNPSQAAPTENVTTLPTDRKAPRRRKTPNAASA